MKVLVLNAGSSSIKYQLFDMASTPEQVLTAGVIDRIGEAGSEISSHLHALEFIIQHLQRAGVHEIDAIGHRTVHGGEQFQAPVLITDEVIQAIQAMIPLAPLHNPANLLGIEVARKLFPDLPQVAVFDTAFHHTMPPVAFRYALPAELYHQHKVRRYGFHGTSHQYVAQRAADYLKRDLSELNLITLHLGNGCSVTAIAKGKSIDTSMGMTPLEGLVMGTRCGDLDPALHFYLQHELKMPFAELERLLNKQSGLKGLCGVSDMREVQQRAQAGDMDAQLAEAMFVYRIKKYIGAYFAILGEVNSIVFTGGIGENATHIRELICHNMQGLGLELDILKNKQVKQELREINTAQSRVKIMEISTNEELAIARATIGLL